MAKRTTKRADEVREERRRKPGQMQYGGGRLAVDESALDRDTYEYRFVNDRNGRVQKLYEQDWDRVNDPNAKPDANAQGTVRSVHGGTEESGQPYQQVLMRKRKDWYEADQKEKQEPLKEMEDQIRKGIPQTETAEDKELKSHAYVPGGGSSIETTRGAKP